MKMYAKRVYIDTTASKDALHHSSYFSNCKYENIKKNLKMSNF